MSEGETFPLEDLSRDHGPISLIELPGTITSKEVALSCINWPEYRGVRIFHLNIGI